MPKTIYKYTYERASEEEQKEMNFHGYFPYVKLYDPEGNFLGYFWDTQDCIKSCVRKHREENNA